jgi:enoyl-CoA hydratase
MVRLDRRDDVLVVTLDRPERRNAVDHATLLELADAQRVAADDRVRVVVLTGEPPAFCAGADLTGVEDGEFVRLLGEVLRGFGTLDALTVAAVDGPALGAGTQLAIACDLRIATASSPFGIPAAKLGLAVDAWTLARLTSEFGAATARTMLLTGETVTAERLHDWGSVHRLGDLADALTWADELARLAPLTIAAHKFGLERPGDDGFERRRLAAWRSADAEEGRTAFLDKRRPRFTGR